MSDLSPQCSSIADVRPTRLGGPNPTQDTAVVSRAAAVEPSFEVASGKTWGIEGAKGGVQGLVSARSRCRLAGDPEGRSGTHRIQRDDAGNYPIQIAAYSFVGGSRGGAFLSGKDFEPPWEQYVRVAMIPIATHRDYFVAITQEGGGPDCFCWELRHRKTPMGVKVRVHGFRSPEAAEVAGKTALAEFLEGLSIEESLGA